MKNLQLELYKNYFLSIKRGMSIGVVSNAKLIYILSLLSYPLLIIENVISFEDKELHRIYNEIADEYKETKISPILLPFFHLRTAPFYELIWKHEVPKEKLSHTPSAKFLRENLSHAKLDDDLWALLKEPNNREYLKNCIIETYLK